MLHKRQLFKKEKLYINVREIYFIESTKEVIMPTENLTGSFNYTALKDAMMKRGIYGANLNAALTKVASKNNIDDITKLNGTKNITIEGSIFEQYASNVNSISRISNPFEINKPQTDDNSKNQNLSEIDLFGNKFKNNSDLPEIFNDDDYDVVDYDDYYNFGGAAEAQNQNQNQNEPQNESEKGMSFDEFKQAHMNGTYGNPGADNATSPFGSTNNDDKDATLYNVFSQFDEDKNNYLDNNELHRFEEMSKAASGMMTANFDSSNKNQDISQEGQDPFGSSAMDMDMQQEANPDSK